MRCVHPEHGGNQGCRDRQLRQRPLFVEGIDHLDVERGRFIETTNHMVEKNVGVLEKPGDEHAGEGNSHEARFAGDSQQQRKD